MIAVDSSVVIDLLGDDANAPAAEACLREALGRGPVVLCDIVVSEITAGLGSGDRIMDVLEDLGIGFSAVERKSAVRAGEMQRRYRERLRVSNTPPPAPRTVPDFLIGAHALLQCSALITRDVGFFRDYFKGLKVVVPQPGVSAP